MDDRALTALKGSIDKWQGIVNGTMLDFGVDNCPLCRIFYSQGACVGCPVSERTGLPGCNGTPYFEYEESDEDGGLAAAKRELEFLKSLLPTEENNDAVVTDTE